jgi:hypothetical protein
MSAAGGIDPDGQDDGLLGPWHAEPEPEEQPDSHDALETMAVAGAVLQAFAAGTLRVEAPEPDPEPEADPEPEPDPEPDPEPAAEVVSEPARDVVPEVAHDPEPDVVFAPRTTLRTAVSLLSVAAIAGTGLAAWTAYDEQSRRDLGIAVTLAILTVLLLTLRAGTSVARLAVRDSRLEVVRAGTRMVFDLDDPGLQVEVVGTPGRRGWKVVFPRRSLPPAVVDARMVDPREFSRVVELHRARARSGRFVS